VSAKVGSMLRDDDEMSGALGYDLLTAGTDVILASLVRLDGTHDRRVEGWIQSPYPRNAHSTAPAVMTANPTTSTRSVIDFRCGRKGLKPIPAW
jgi:hypothetical protein